MTRTGDRRPDVAVVGGGMIGLACARALAARGLAVAVLERGHLGRAASWAAAGMLAPLAEVPEPGPMFDACHSARDAWADFAGELEEETGVDVDYDRSGAVLLDDGTYDLEANLRLAQTLGEHAERLESTDLRKLIPGLSPTVDQALLLAGEHRVSNRRVCRALAQSVVQRGVDVRETWPVTKVVARPRGWTLVGPAGVVEASRVLVCAGAWSGGITGMPRLPVRPIRGQMLRLEGVDWPWLGSVRGNLYAVRRAGGGLLIGATMEDAGFDDRTTVAGQRRLLEACSQMFPGLNEHTVVDRWSGLRPSTDDDLPVVGPIDEGMWAATGHYRNGILLTPWTVETVVAGMVDGVRPPTAFGATRFQPVDYRRA